MAQDDLTPEQDRDDASPMASQDTAMPVSEPVSSDAETTPRDRAMEIFRAREFDGEPLRMGQVLRRVREALGLEIADVSRATLMRKDYLMWIERMEVGELPRGGYLTAILNTYAKYLQLPEKEVIRIYSQECGAVEEVYNDAPVPKIGGIAPEKAKWPLAVAAAAVLVAMGAGALGVSQLVRPNVELAPEPGVVAVNGARDSLFADAATSDRPVPKNLPLELSAIRQGWLEVRGADGTIFRSRVMAAGESYFPRLQAGWTVSARDGGAFEWRVGDVTIGPLGPDATPVFSISIDEQIGRAADAATPAMAANGGNKATR
jgi:cytoskeleton protein RodZ